MSVDIAEQVRQTMDAAAVVVLRDGDTPEVESAAPPGLMRDLTWLPGRLVASTDLVTDGRELARLVPTSVRLLIGHPEAALLTRIAQGTRAVLVVWTQTPTGDVRRQLDEVLNSGVEVALAAAAAQATADRERADLAAVLAALDSAVVTIDPDQGEARYNNAAAQLLGLPVSANLADVAQAMTALQRRAVNSEEVVAVAQGVSVNGAVRSAVWRFDEQPTHLKVTTRPLRDGSHRGRVWVFTDVSTEYALVEQEQQARLQLRITADAMLDPQVLLLPVYTQGRVVDFVYGDVNRACCEYLGMPRVDLIGQSVELTLPQLRNAGLLEDYAEVMRTGRPLVLDDFCFYNDLLADQRRYDIRAAKAGDGLTLTWRDVTQRFEDARLLQESQERLAATLDSMLSPHMMLAAVRGDDAVITDFIVRDVNAAAVKYLRMSRDQLIGASLRSRLSRDRHTLLFGWCVDVVDGVGRVDLDDVRFPADGDSGHRFLDVKMVRVGEEASFTFRDVTERHEMVGKIAESEEHYRLLAQNSSDVVLLIRDQHMAWLSPALTTALGWQPGQWQGRDIIDVIHEADREAVNDHLRRVALGATEVITARVADLDGGEHWIELHSSPYVDAQGEQTGVVASFRVVDDEVAADQMRDRQARIDELTGLLNRREALKYLRSVVAESATTGSHVGVLFCDVDRFKDINDGFGHAGGDEVLRVLAHRLMHGVRKLDVVARMGGDELVVILPGVSDEKGLHRIASQIHRQMSQAVPFEGRRIPVTVSVGAALAQSGEQPDHLVARADAAMYEAKRTGRNRVVVIE